MGLETLQRALRMAGDLLPESTRQIVEQSVQNRAAAAGTSGSPGEGNLFGIVAPVAGLLFTLWSTSGGMKALFAALSIIYDAKERRGWLRFQAITFAFTLGVLLLLSVCLGLIVFVPRLLALTGLGDTASRIVELARWPILFVLAAAALSILNRYAPWRPERSWPWITIGTMAASLLLVLNSALFSWFTATFASLALTYGSLSTVVAFMIWLWASFVIVLAAAELDACIDQETDAYRSGASRPDDDR